MSIEQHTGFQAFMEHVRIIAMLDNPDNIAARPAEVQDTLDAANEAIARMVQSVSLRLTRLYHGERRAMAEHTTLYVSFTNEVLGRKVSWGLSTEVTASQRSIQSPDDLPWVFEGNIKQPVPSEWTHMITHALDPWTYEALR